MASRLLRVALVASVVSACAGPVPSGSPDASVPVDVSPETSLSMQPLPGSTAINTPDPTPEPTQATRTEVEVNGNVIDRPGVPDDFHDTYWWTSFGQAGQVGTTAWIGLPDGERIITAGSGLVVSAVIEFEGDMGALLLIRDIRTGALVREIETQLLLPAAVIVDGRLYWAAGLRGVGPSEPDVGNAVDGGVWTVQLEGDEPPKAIVEPGTDLGSVLGGRAPFSVSPTGLTIASNVGGSHRAFATDIIDTASATRRTRLSDEIVRELDDNIAIAWDEPPTDAPRGWVRAVEIDSGERLWRFPTLDQRDGFRISVNSIQAIESGFLGQFRREQDNKAETTIAIFDPRDGTRRQILVQGLDPANPEYVSVVFGLVSDRYAALSNEPHSTIEDLFLEDAAVSILDLDSGLIQPAAFSLAP